MLSRHYIRSKVLQTIYAAQADVSDIVVVEKNFKHNILRLNDLGAIQVSALVHLAEMAGFMMDEAQHKFRPTKEELHPNRRFPENVFIQKLADNYDYRHLCEASKVNWGGVEYDEIFRQLFLQLKQLSIYREYIATTPSFKTDQQFALKVFKFLMNDENLLDHIYPQSLWWEDDFDQIAQYNFMMLKALDETMDESTTLPRIYDARNEKDAEAFEFARQLLLVVMRHENDVEGMVRKHLKGWEYERVANMDLLLLNMAIAELTSCPSIPERVTIDEYIELSKEFSTERSKLFINGILDKLIIELRSAGRIVKTGRGLAVPGFEDDEDYND